MITDDFKAFSIGFLWGLILLLWGFVLGMIFHAMIFT